jgi:hypothetical protein
LPGRASLAIPGPSYCKPGHTMKYFDKDKEAFFSVPQILFSRAFTQGVDGLQ